MKLKKLAKKFLRVWKQKGLMEAIRRVFHFWGNTEGRRIRREDIAYVCGHKGEVLFVNGCSVPHPTRYRVDHQMEQLREAGIRCAKVYFEDIKPEMEDNYQIFVFFRCECSAEVEEFIARARRHRKKIIFDVDDLVTDTKYTDRVPFVQELSPLDRRLFDTSISLMGKTLALSDAAVTTTRALADELGKRVAKVYINRNTASKEMVACAEAAWKERSRRPGQIQLGYFSGSLTHNRDFDVVRSALIKILEAYPQTRLILMGELEVSDELVRYKDRITKLEATDWRTLPRFIVQADINLAPLEDTLFNRAKSELKWLEAALVRVPTIASNVGAFQEIIIDGTTGILCENEENAWYEGMKKLVEDAQMREELGGKAYQYVMGHCTTASSAAAYGNLIKSLM